MAEEASTEKTKNLSENEEKSTFSDSKEYETTEKERIGDVDDETGTTENDKTKTEEKMAEDEGTDPKIKLVAMDNKEQEAEKTATAADYTCPICFKKLYSKYSRDRHVKLHKNLCETEKYMRRKIPSYPLKCSLCKMSFVYQHSYDNHVKDNHTNTAKEEVGSNGQKKRKYALNCLFCENSFKYKNSLSIHIKRCHSSDDGPENLLNLNLSQLKCPKCEAKFMHDT